MMNTITSLLIVTVIGVGGPRHEQLHNIEVHAVPTFFDTHEPRGPLRGGVTNKHGRVRVHLAPGGYIVTAFRGGRLCPPRNVVTLTGGTKRVTLTCHIR
jgi:hypothetical protein